MDNEFGAALQVRRVSEVERKRVVGPISPGTRTTRMRHWGIAPQLQSRPFGVQEQSLECGLGQRTLDMHNGLFWMLDYKMPKARAIHEEKSQSFVILTISMCALAHHLFQIIISECAKNWILTEMVLKTIQRTADGMICRWQRFRKDISKWFESLLCGIVNSPLK